MCRVGSDDAHDIVQRTFIVVLRKLDKSGEGEGVRAWIFGIAERELMAWRRENKKAGQEVLEKSHNPWPFTTSGIVLRDAISKLSEPLAGAFVMMEIMGLSVREIAEIQQVPEGTVLSRLHTARARLREILKTGEIE